MLLFFDHYYFSENKKRKNVDIKLHFIALISNHLGNNTYICVCVMLVCGGYFKEIDIFQSLNLLLCDTFNSIIKIYTYYT